MIPNRELKILYGRAGGMCAFEDCRENLILNSNEYDKISQIGEIAHIIAHSPMGPRGDPNYPKEKLNKYENLILLCPTCHKKIDTQPHKYTAEILQDIKEKHECWVQQQIGKGMSKFGFTELKVAQNSIKGSNIDNFKVLKYSIHFGIITALPHEYTAFKVMLENPREITISGSGAGRRYLLGKIPSCNGSEHSIALTLLTDMGNNIAATRATRMLEHFPNIKSIIMVGIAGGVPNPTKVDEHVRLGDIVVSDQKGVIQYDFDKETISETIQRHPPRPPSAVLLEAVRHLEAATMEGKRPWIKYINYGLDQLSISRPPEESDILISSTNPKINLSHPNDPERIKNEPKTFLGTIAAANKLLKNPIKRDNLRDKFGVKAVEMESSGIADATWYQEVGYLAVRGICDYCDSNKGDAWQKYAAITAAGYTKALLETIPSIETIRTTKSTIDLKKDPIKSENHTPSYIDLLEDLDKKLENNKPDFSDFDEYDEAVMMQINEGVSISYQFIKMSLFAIKNNDIDAIRQIYEFFGNLLNLYNINDADGYKFLIYEMFVSFIATLIKYNKWEFIDELLTEDLFVENSPLTYVPFTYINRYLKSLEDSRKKRLNKNRVSLMADIIEERFTKTKLSNLINHRQFMEADYFLFIRTICHKDNKEWIPRASILLDKIPIYLAKAEKKKFLEEISNATGSENIDKFVECLKNNHYNFERIYGYEIESPLEFFNFQRLGTKD
jgi:Nucleoside phosphorylase